MYISRALFNVFLVHYTMYFSCIVCDVQAGCSSFLSCQVDRDRLQHDDGDDDEDDDGDDDDGDDDDDDDDDGDQDEDGYDVYDDDDDDDDEDDEV